MAKFLYPLYSICCDFRFSGKIFIQSGYWCWF